MAKKSKKKQVKAEAGNGGKKKRSALAKMRAANKKLKKQVEALKTLLLTCL